MVCHVTVCIFWATVCVSCKWIYWYSLHNPFIESEFRGFHLCFAALIQSSFIFIHWAKSFARRKPFALHNIIAWNQIFKRKIHLGGMQHANDTSLIRCKFPFQWSIKCYVICWWGSEEPYVSSCGCICMILLFFCLLFTHYQQFSSEMTNVQLQVDFRTHRVRIESRLAECILTIVSAEYVLLKHWKCVENAYFDWNNRQQHCWARLRFSFASNITDCWIFD